MEELEKEKLLLEIKKLKKPWYSNLEFWKVTIPTVAILASLYFAFGRGILDTEKSKLEAQKEQLKLEIVQFEIQKKEISHEILEKDSTRKLLEGQIKLYSSQKFQLLKEVGDLNSKIKTVSNEKLYVESERVKDKNFFYDELKRQYNNEKERLNELNRLYATINQKSLAIDTLDVELSFLRKKAKLSTDEIYQLTNMKYNAQTRFYENKIKNSENNLEILNKKYDEEKNRIKNLNSDEQIRLFELNMLKYQWLEKK
jgi:hypothetical protein